MAGKDSRLADAKREKKRTVEHEDICHVCFDDSGDLVDCYSCPRAYHHGCLEPMYQAKVKSWSGFYCPQHSCVDCGKKAGDAGGLIFRCRWCQRAFCEDCLDWDKTVLVGDNLPEFEIMGEPPNARAHYIKCSPCIDWCAKDEDGDQWVTDLEASYTAQFDSYMEQLEEERKAYEKEQERLEALGNTATKDNPLIVESDSETPSPLALADIRAKSDPALTESDDGSRKAHTEEPESVATPNSTGTGSDYDYTGSDVVSPPTHTLGSAAAKSNPIFVESDTGSPPSLTDTSLPTPAPMNSGVSTPRSRRTASALSLALNVEAVKGSRKGPVTPSKRSPSDNANNNWTKRKKIQEESTMWNINDDPLLKGFMTVEPEADLALRPTGDDVDGDTEMGPTA
jgi:hypothetical protein